MHKFFKLTGVSILAVAAASNANAAGYTCEELIEYTSCNTGYYLNSGDCIEGTTCGAGNYLKSSCQEDYSYGTGWCKTWDVWESGHTAESCQEKCDEAGEDGCQFFVEGCVFTDAIYGDAEGVSASDFDASANKVCTPCATGTYQPSAGQSSCMRCPAGSECPTTTAATLCDIGEYSSAGATACSSCPSTGLTDINNAVVVATTASKGSTTLHACYIDSNTYFKDAAGTYHYKSKCNWDILRITSVSETECNAIEAGAWNDVDEVCVLSRETVESYVTTPEQCDILAERDDEGRTFWSEEFDEPYCNCDGSWIIFGSGLKCSDAF